MSWRIYCYIYDCSLSGLVLTVFSLGKKWSMTKRFTRAKYGVGSFKEVISLMKKAKNGAKKNMTPDSNALEGIPAQEPHEEYAKKDANFKKRRGDKR